MSPQNDQEKKICKISHGGKEDTLRSSKEKVHLKYLESMVSLCIIALSIKDLINYLVKPIMQLL